MTLKFNPFEKDKAAPIPQTKRPQYRVFDDPTRDSPPVLNQINEVVLAENTAADKTDYKQTTNGSQTDHTKTNKRTTNRPQTDHNIKVKKEKRTTQRTTERITTRLQTDYKRITKTEFGALVGHERNLLIFIFNECRVTGELTTTPITISRIKETLKTKASSTAKTVIARLIEKGFLHRETSKTGRGGWVSFRLEQEIFQRLLLETDYKRTTNRSQTDHKETTKQTTQRTTTALSSSSNIDLNKETTTTGNGSDHIKNTELISTNPNWEKIDHESLKEIGFNASHVAQVVKQGLHTPQSLQDSIYAFKFDLNANKRGSQIQGSALNYFMGILRKGPYAPPHNYESPEDKQLREYLEAKEKLLESKRTKLNRIKEIEFEEWMDSLSKSERDALAPMGTSDHLKRTQLRNHFDEHIWELKKEKLVGDFESRTGSESSIFFESTIVNRENLPPLTPP